MEFLIAAPWILALVLLAFEGETKESEREEWRHK